MLQRWEILCLSQVFILARFIRLCLWDSISTSPQFCFDCRGQSLCDQRGMDEVAYSNRRAFSPFIAIIYDMDAIHSRLDLCLKAIGHSREITLIKYKGWLLSHLVPVCFGGGHKEGTVEISRSMDELFPYLGYLHVGKPEISLADESFIPYWLHLRRQDLILQAKCIQRVEWELSPVRQPLGRFHLPAGKRSTDCPNNAHTEIQGIKGNAKCGRGSGSKKRNHSQKIPPHKASPYLLQGPIRAPASVLSLLGQIIKEWLENTFL